MMIKKHLLTSLITVLGLLRLIAQDPVQVFGAVINANGSAQAGVSINVSAYFADSTFFQESVLTGVYGEYEVLVPNPDPNQWGFIQVDMIDCNNTIQTQFVQIENGVPATFEANFVYCANNTPDSCLVYILIENNPGTNLIQLTAWTPLGITAEYLWSTGETTQTIIPTQDGSYAVTATFPELNCTAVDSVWVALDSLGFCYAFIVSSINPDSSTFTLEAVPTGLAPYSYLWSTGETTSIITNVPPGEYWVIVTDAMNCSYTAYIYVDISGFCEAYIGVDPSGGLTVYGYGTPPFWYQWNTGETTQTIYPQKAGLYCATVTDANGCSAATCIDYWFPMDSCFVWVNGFMVDSNTFALQAYPSGWGQSFTYLWSTGETTDIIYPSDPFATYCVTVVDDFGCTSTGCYDPNNWCYTWVDLQYIDTTTAVLTAFNDPIFNWPGLPDPTYVWSTGETSESITVDSSGSYCVTVTLGTGCVTEACAYVDFEGLSNSCSAWVFAYPDSSFNQWYAEVVPWGFGEFSYLWHNGDTTSSIEITHPQAYACVTVTSSLGCETVACLDSFYNPCTPWVDIFYESDSSATLTATSWNDPAQNGTYQWSNGQTTPTITVFQEGQYCVTVSAAGCQGVACVDVYFHNVENCGVWVSSADTTFGTIFFANAWGTPPFMYQWDNGSTDPFIIVDLGSLEHCVTITDATGCMSAGCSYFIDSCYAEIILNYLPEPQLFLSSWDPIVSVQWSTNDPADTLLWLDIDAPGTYCATYTTLNGCYSSTCIKVDTLLPGSPAGVINGWVFNDAQTHVEGNVNAYRLNNGNGDIYELAASTPIGPDGFYFFDSLATGVYIIKAEPAANTPTAELYIPTYYRNSASWEIADPIVVPNWLPVTNDILLIRQQPGGGPGVIGGVIADPGNFMAEQGEVRGEGGLANIVILLHDEYGQVLDYTLSLEDGSFRFTDLTLGTYRLKFDIPGIASQEVWVTLTQAEPEKLQVNFLIETTVDVEDPQAEQINLYPNPASTEIHMAVPGNNVPYDIQVVDVTGKVVYAGSARNYNSILSVDVSALSHGLYQVNLVSNSRLFYGRFVKQE